MHAHDESYRLHQAIAFKLRGLLMVPPMIFLFLWTQWEWEHDVGVWTMGALLFLPGVALRVWSQRYLRYRLREGKGLATTGPYAWIRNPVYIGNLLILAGLCVMCELPWMVPIMIGWAALVYHEAVSFEEYRLRKRYGQAFTDYCERVPRWLPRMRTSAPIDARYASLWRAAAVEWQCLLLVVVPIVKEFWH
ncbi:MAG: isoprenylcysteine carboxylmethyltransferase family protein [Phycisphaerae bacterium]|nr:isoprenylcysteine carboxylmethyltransferase family protein [Phycisphaerae bacterium]